MTKLVKGKWLLLAALDTEPPSLASSRVITRLDEMVRAKKGVCALICPSATGVRMGTEHFADSDSKIANAWRIPGAPFFALVGPDGTIVWHWFGFKPGQEKELLDSLPKKFSSR
jgi:hypothetical protein